MPSPNSFWVVSFRPDSDESYPELAERLSVISSDKNPSLPLAQLVPPAFKVAPLSTLINLSETLSKNEAFANQTLQKIVETLKSLVASKPSAFLRNKLPTSDPQAEFEDNLLMDDGRSYEAYLLKNWEWNRGKYNRVENRKLEEVVDVLLKDITSIDNSHKVKLSTYNQTKAQSAALRRKKNGNLSTKSLADVVLPEHFVDPSSEFLETLLVAVPNNLVRDWHNSYEHLTSLVVPRSSTKIAQDDEFTLFNVTVFRKIKEEYARKCRESKFVVRDFTFDATEIEKARLELRDFEQQEKELWSELLRLSRINFSDTFQAIVHLKIIQTFIESLLRYGLPPHYCIVALKPERKTARKVLNQLKLFHDSLEGNTNTSKKKTKKSGINGNSTTDDMLSGEYAGILEREIFDFVLFEIIDPKRDGKDA